MNPGENVAPDSGRPQTDLVLRKLKDVLENGKDNDVKQLEEATGMSRQEIEQFVEKFQKPKDTGPSRDPGQIEGKLGEPQRLDPNRKLPDQIRSPLVSGRGQRGPGSVVQDSLQDQTQGVRTQAPAQIRSRFEAYQSSISRSPAARPSKPAAGGNGEGGR